MRETISLLALVGLLAACGASLADQEKDARTALDGRDWAKARTVAEQALLLPEAGKDLPTAWRLEQVRMEALAHAKQGAEVVSTLERLAGKYPQQVTPALYRSLADKLNAAGETSGAIDVLAAGDKRFPAEHAAFTEAIDALKQGGLDPAQIEKLKALGYL